MNHAPGIIVLDCYHITYYYYYYYSVTARSGASAHGDAVEDATVL